MALYADIIKIPNEVLKKFGKAQMPEGFEMAYLKKSPKEPSSVEYNIIIQLNGKQKHAGKIDVKKRLLEPHCLKKNGEIIQLKGQHWDRRIEMFDSLKGQSWGHYGLTMAAVYTFMQELDKAGIEETISVIKGDNVASLRLSEKMVGMDVRMQVVDGDALPKIKKHDLYIYKMSVKEYLSRMEKHHAQKQQPLLMTRGASR